MRSSRFLFLFLFLSNLLFAQYYAPKNSCLFNSLFVSISIAISIIAILLIIGSLFNFQDLKFLAIKEIESLAILVLILVFVLLSFNPISKNLAKSFNLDPSGWSNRFSSNYNYIDIKSLKVSQENITVQQKAFILVEENNKLLKVLNDRLDKFAESIAIESSKSYYFNFYGNGFGIGVCSTFSSLRGPLNMLYTAISTASFGIYFTKFFLNIFANQIICILFPIGLFLAFFNLTRKVGIFLVSLCISFYFVFPTSLLILLDYYNVYYGSYFHKIIKGNSITLQNADLENSIPDSVSCDPKSYNSLDIPNTANFVLNYLNSNSDKILSFVLLKSIFIPLLALSLTLSFSSAIAHGLGLEIDLSILSRLS
ncbi:MAG: hypothetical protein QXV83_03930 [Candidatus Anstonellaceae archaeon]